MKSRIKKSLKKALKRQHAEWMTIKVARSTYDKLHALEQRVAAEGWAKFGAVRTDSPTLGNIVDEAINGLAAK